MIELAKVEYITIETSNEYLTIWPNAPSVNDSTTKLQISQDFIASYRTFVPNLYVEKGQKIFFRVKCGNQLQSNGEFDKVNWSPTVTYSGKTQTENYSGVTDENGYSDADFSSENTLVSKIGYNFIDSTASTITVTSQFSKPITTDDVTIRAYLANDSIFVLDSLYDNGDVDSLGQIEYIPVSYIEHNPDYENRVVFRACLKTSN